MAICDFCKADMLNTDHCLPHVIVYGDGDRLPAKPFGGEWGRPGQRCHDCNVLYGEYHHPGCDMEECPHCGGQLISCSCGVASWEAAPAAPGQKSAPAPFPPVPSSGERIAEQVEFPGVGKCDIWLTEDVTATDFQSQNGQIEEFARVYSPNLCKHIYCMGQYNADREYVPVMAVQLRVRPGSEEASVVRQVIDMITKLH